MSKQEFLDILGNALSQSFSGNELNSHIQYYREYINSEMGKGLSEEEVIGSLGDPRLIAKTILETSGNQTGYGNSRKRTEYGQSTFRRGDYGTEDGDWSSEGRDVSGRGMRERSGSSVWHLILGILIIAGVIGLVVSLVFTVLPAILPVIAVLLLFSYLRKRL